MSRMIWLHDWCSSWLSNGQIISFPILVSFQLHLKGHAKASSFPRVKVGDTVVIRRCMYLALNWCYVVPSSIFYVSWKLISELQNAGGNCATTLGGICCASKTRDMGVRAHQRWWARCGGAHCLRISRLQRTPDQWQRVSHLNLSWFLSVHYVDLCGQFPWLDTLLRMGTRKTLNTMRLDYGLKA